MVVKIHLTATVGILHRVDQKSRFHLKIKTIFADIYVYRFFSDF